MATKRRDVEQTSLSFLDCICCGFGAIILLLVLAKTAEPMVLEETREDLSGLIADMQRQLVEIRGEVQVLDRTLVSKREQLSEIKTRIARLRQMISEIKGEYEAADSSANAIAKLEDQLEKARQELNAAQQKFSYQKPFEETLVGGIPVDSEYIIFIIDTSGSMYNYAWEMVLRKVTETLDVYPEVKGIQVMNDMGQYMFPGRGNGKWIKDTPRLRELIRDRLRTWNAFSNSSPVEGINKAIRTFYSPDKDISLYVFGDDFTGGSIERVVAQIDRINQNKDGTRRVRIHTVGFPVGFLQPAAQQRSNKRFANLMRILAERNNGTFVGLNSVR